MKNIMVLFDAPNDFDNPLDTEEYLVAYQDLSLYVSQLGGTLYFARDVRELHLNNLFPSVGYFDASGSLQHTTNVVADLIYDKARTIRLSSQCPIINDQTLKLICNDKAETYKRFSNLSPKTVVVLDASEFRALTSSFEGRVVVKPQFGTGGEGIIIDDVINIDIKKLQFPCLVQEFLDGSAGIEGIYKGLHDLRMVIINGEIAFTYMRLPKEGSLLSNLHQGASVKLLDVEQLPDTALNIVKEVEKTFSKFGQRYYCIDVMNTSSGLKLIELNAQPGLLSRTRSDKSPEYLQKIALLLCGKSKN